MVVNLVRSIHYLQLIVCVLVIAVVVGCALVVLLAGLVSGDQGDKRI